MQTTNRGFVQNVQTLPKMRVPRKKKRSLMALLIPTASLTLILLQPLGEPRHPNSRETSYRRSEEL